MISDLGTRSQAERENKIRKIFGLKQRIWKSLATLTKIWKMFGYFNEAYKSMKL